MLLYGGYYHRQIAVVDKGQKREEQSPFGSATAWFSFVCCRIQSVNRLINHRDSTI